MKSYEDWPYNYARGNLRAFIKGSKSLNWLLGTIKSSGVQGARLAEILENHRDYGNRERYEIAVIACQQQGWLR